MMTSIQSSHTGNTCTRMKFLSPVKANRDFELLVLFAGELNARIIIDASLIHADIVSIIVVDVVLMNNVEIIM